MGDPALPPFVVAQLGARRSYIVPRVLHEAGRLARLYTDLCAASGWLGAARRVVPAGWHRGRVRRVFERVPAGIPPGLIRADAALGVRYAGNLARARTFAQSVRAMYWSALRFDAWVAGDRWPDGAGVYVMDGATCRTARRAAAEGRFVAVEQTIAPAEVQLRLLEEENAAFPGWEPVAAIPAGIHRKACDLYHATWAAASVIVCGSEFVVDGVRAVGGPADRCVVVPYDADPGFEAGPRGPHPGPLRVVVVGTVGLRKGAPYVLAAARRLRGAATVRMVGPVGVTPAARAELEAGVELTGGVPRSAIRAHLGWADVFLLPSLCEGSASAVYEAMAAGLPVVTTPNTGSVVRDGVDGFVVPVRDPGAIADRIGRLAADPGLRAEMGARARARAREFSGPEYGRRLLAALRGRGPEGGRG